MATVRDVHPWECWVKRALDLGGATLALVLFAPVMAVLWVAIKLDSAGPALFTQKRLGLGGRPFPCLKFRTMRVDAEAVLNANAALHREYRDRDYKLPVRTDPRVTRVGRFLRRTSLDELPQLVNVVLGQMSLVGPRPVVPPEIEHFGDDAAELLSVRPGITGAWVVKGRNRVEYPERANLELTYVRTWSLAGDFVILYRTVKAVIDGEGL